MVAERRRYIVADAGSEGGGPDLEAGSLVDMETSGLGI